LLHRLFANKGMDAINLGNILHHKYVRAMVPHDFKDQSVPIISYVLVTIWDFLGYHRITEGGAKNVTRNR